MSIKQEEAPVVVLPAVEVKQKPPVRLPNPTRLFNNSKFKSTSQQPTHQLVDADTGVKFLYYLTPGEVDPTTGEAEASGFAFSMQIPFSFMGNAGTVQVKNGFSTFQFDLMGNPNPFIRIGEKVLFPKDSDGKLVWSQPYEALLSGSPASFEREDGTVIDFFKVEVQVDALRTAVKNAMAAILNGKGEPLEDSHGILQIP